MVTQQEGIAITVILFLANTLWRCFYQSSLIIDIPFAFEVAFGCQGGRPMSVDI
ncbi:hypothetical protein Rin_00007040 [Candidatus Regiella insecticola 5.15]|uniref:Uncharacterized protein n=2 Tax=Candidatus Regiella insecticola TaxID=138073 RepID=G2GY53_9ENTR|nr:hypothetical protein Rin_00007040 [Candidatus Regiella insecticola 5.15]